jgi:uncharacterized membrane protein YeaQ/YmgE (transglycosylase-associated protein family)
MKREEVFIMIMSLFLWALLGAAAGWIASFITGGRGWMANTIIGVLGAILGGAVMNDIGITGITGFNIYSLIIAVIGAIVLLLVLPGRYEYNI